MADVLETLMVLFRGDSAQLRREFDAIQRESAETKAKVTRDLDFRSIGASLGGFASGGGILYALRSAADESVRTAAAVRTYENAVERAGLSQDTMAGLVDRVADRFGLLRSQVQDAAAPLIKIGLDAETVEETLIGLGASGGLVGADIARSMSQGAQGIAMGRSELLEYSGVMANASDGQKMLAGELGTSVGQLNNQQKALGYARAVINETRSDVDDFTHSYGEYNRAQADASKQAAELRDRVGQLAQEGLVPLNQALSGALNFVNELPDGTLRTATAFVAAGAGATTLAAGVGTLALVLGPLAGPVGLFILVAAGIAAFVTASNNVPESVRQAKGATDELTGAYDDLKVAVENASGAEREAARQRAQLAIDEGSQALKRAQADLRAQVQTTRAGLAAGGGTPGNPIFEQTVMNAPPVVALTGEIERLETQLQAAVDLQQQLLNPPTNPDGAGNGNGNGAGGGGGSGSGKRPRTLEEIFDEVGTAGTLAEQRANALGDTLEARLEAAETRADLLSTALNDVLELDNPSPKAIENLVARLQDAQAEATKLQALISGDTSDAILGQLDRDAGYTGTGPDSSALGAQQELFAEGEARQAEAARQRADAEAIVLDTKQAQREVNLDLLEQARSINADTQSAMAQAAEVAAQLQASANASNEGRGGMRQSYIDANNPLVVGEGGYLDQLQSFSGTNAELAEIRDNVRESLADGEITLQQYRELLAIYERLASAGPIDLVGSPNGPKGSANTGQSVALLPGATDPDTGRPLEGGVTPTVTVDADPFAEAGAAFLSGLEGIFASFGSELGSTLASLVTGGGGELDAGGLAGGLAGLGGTFLGNMILPGLGSFLGPVLGNFVGGLFGGDSERDSRSRAEQDAERRGGASSIELTVIFTQNNNFEGNFQEQVAELRRVGREQIGDVIKQINPSQFAIKPT